MMMMMMMMMMPLASVDCCTAFAGSHVLGEVDPAAGRT
jgi:hypothetical protein